MLAGYNKCSGAFFESQNPQKCIIYAILLLLDCAIN